MLKQVVSSACTSVRLTGLLPGLAGFSSRLMSVESHDDFKPEIKHAAPVSIQEMIDHDVKSNKVMVYMKGSPAQPQCGFSARVVALMKAYGIDFEYRNVLEDDELRQGIKEYRQWPTIPQVFVNGELVGGCDILWDEHEKGTFAALMDAEKA